MKKAAKKCAPTKKMAKGGTVTDTTKVKKTVVPKPRPKDDFIPATPDERKNRKPTKRPLPAQKAFEIRKTPY